MSRKSGQHRPCSLCGHPTRSLTRLCSTHRRADDAPVVTVDGPVLSVAGIALSPAQAITLANRLVDLVEHIEHATEPTKGPPA